MLVHTGIKWIAFPHAHLLNKWISPLSRAALLKFSFSYFFSVHCLTVCWLACFFKSKIFNGNFKFSTPFAMTLHKSVDVMASVSPLNYDETLNASENVLISWIETFSQAVSFYLFSVYLLFFCIEQIEDSFKVDKLNWTHHPTCICYEIYRHNWSFLLVDIHEFWWESVCKLSSHSQPEVRSNWPIRMDHTD